ncbi:hypothetical protein MNBD_GAMMA12-1773 [hydrothermal vent metagenome]|uniref:DUF72 domain-containing protein n=1 Tax=hydrothermal vent metagenome TaxID=652676 RepID=A0A3B0YAR3_9ZZZZ
MTGFVEIGSIGWEHEQWINDYYPQDLPSDWLFSYYSKQFHTVWLRPIDLLNKTAAQIQSCIEDCEQSFEFLLEMPVLDNRLDVNQWVKQARLLQPYILAYVIPVSAALSVDYIKSTLSLLATEKLPDIFLLPEKGAISLDKFSTLSNVYEIATPESVSQKVDSQIMVVDFQSADDMRMLGKTLNIFVTQNSLHHKLYCYFRGEPPSYSLMQTAQTIIPMLAI